MRFKFSIPVFKPTFFLSSFLWLLITNSSSSQPSQTLRGTITDLESKAPLTGVNVILYKDSTIIKAASTDADGKYRLENVSVGRQRIKFSYLGYKEIVVDNVIVTSAKEVVLNMTMEESVSELEEVVVNASQAGEVRNEMATVSTRAFTVEETDRYAGSRGDPARMASNFAGVQGADDSRNDIVIRGNSPSGVLWRMEGIDIFNPNHFAIPGTSGGPVSIINNKFLSNSDFYTGAFPAEFGNTTAGIFNLYLRNGNNEKYEFSGQFGFLGMELLAEGPLSPKESSRTKNHTSSFLATYRYSTLQLFSLLGIDIGTTATPKYQDAFFRLNFPLDKKNTISFFGMGGISDVAILISDQKQPERNIYGENDRDQYFNSRLGLLGATWQHIISEKKYNKLSIMVQGNQQKAHHELVYRHVGSDGDFVLDSLQNILRYTFQESKISAGNVYNLKLSKKWLLRFGANADLWFVNYIDSIRSIDTSSDHYYQYSTRWDNRNQPWQVQLFEQLKFKPTDRLTINFGFHHQLLNMQSDQDFGVKAEKISVSYIEPRFGIKYDLGHQQSIAFATGLHSQQQTMYLYYYRLQDGVNEPLPPHNWQMDFTRAFHAVASYQKIFGQYVLFSTEIYYQYLYNVPVTADSSSFSLINTGTSFSRFFPDLLVNEGTGFNYGAEFTLQRVFHKGYFFLTTISLFNSKYKGSDGVMRNTDFNGHYVANLLGTKEFKLKNKNVFGVGGKITFEGGRWYGPVDTLTSEQQREVIYVDSQVNTLQFPNYFRLDLKLNYKINNLKVTHEFGLDLVNVTDQQNILKLTYAPDESDPSSSPIRYEYQLGFLPLFYYRIDF